MLEGAVSGFVPRHTTKEEVGDLAVPEKCKGC